jgi:restriction system protein
MLLPTIQALQMLGGSGTTEEIYEKVVQILNLPDKVLEILHGSTSQSEVEYRLAWSRTYLKKYGLLQNLARGVWSLVSTAINLNDLEAKEIVKAVRDADKNKAASSDSATEIAESEDVQIRVYLSRLAHLREMQLKKRQEMVPHLLI